MLLLWGRASHFLFVHPPKILSWREPLFISTSTSNQPPHSCAGRRKSKASSLVATREQLGNNRRPNKDPKLKKKLISWPVKKQYIEVQRRRWQKGINLLKSKTGRIRRMNRNLCRTRSNGAAAYKHRNPSSPYTSEGFYGKMHRRAIVIIKIIPSWKSWSSWQCSDVAPYLVLRWTLPLGPFWCPPTLVNHLRNTHPRWSLS